jgi:predicted MPP superfamily phosphohydrolase
MKKRRIILLIGICFVCLAGLGAIKIRRAILDNDIRERSIIDVKEEEIMVEGINHDYTFFFLTDTHIVVKDESDTEVEKEYANSLTAFVNANGIASVNAFPFWIEYANDLECDAMLMGGDMISYPTEAGVSYFDENISKLKIPYVYTIGNHDWTFPWEYFTNPAYLEMIEPLSEAQVLEYEDLIVFAVDDSTDQISEESLDLFKEYYEVGKPIVLLLHVPVSTESIAEKSNIDWKRNIAIGGSGITPNALTAEFLTLLEAEDSPVVCVLGGHVHFYDRSTLSNGFTVQIVGDDAFSGSGTVIRLKKSE